MKKSKYTQLPKYAAAQAAVTANPVLKHMRNTAYSPVTLPESVTDEEAAKKAAQVKRDKKAAKRVTQLHKE